MVLQKRMIYPLLIVCWVDGVQYLAVEIYLRTGA